MIESQNSQRINEIVQKAQNFLKNNPKDPAHNYYHHKRVWDLCKRIIQQEDLKINEKAVKIAAWWHDVCISEPAEKSIENVKETAKYLKKKVKGLGFNDSTIKKIYDAVRYHEYGDNPRTKEGKVVQDADKLDGFSKKREKGGLKKL